MAAFLEMQIPPVSWSTSSPEVRQEPLAPEKVREEAPLVAPPGSLLIMPGPRLVPPAQGGSARPRVPVSNESLRQAACDRTFGALEGAALIQPPSIETLAGLDIGWNQDSERAAVSRCSATVPERSAQG